jgi:hypothetical protein
LAGGPAVEHFLVYLHPAPPTDNNNGSECMKGNEKVIERLNHALFLELGAVSQYWLHYRLLDDWG